MAAMLASSGCQAHSPARSPEGDTEKPPTFTEASGRWGAGLVGLAYRPPMKDAHGSGDVLPIILYEGVRFSSDLQGIAYRWNDSDSISLSWLGRFRFQGYEAKAGGALEGMADRDPSLDVGMLAQWEGDAGVLDVSAVVDVSGKHEGHEWSAAYSLPVQHGSWLFVPSVGVHWQDVNLADYYYGVRASEALPGRPAYRVGSGWQPYLELSAFYEWTPGTSLLIGAGYNWLSDDVAASPIVAHDYEVNAFLGLLFEF